MADINDEGDHQASLEEQGYVPTMMEVHQAVRTLNASRRVLSHEVLLFAAGQGRRICPMVYPSDAPFLNEDWVNTILNAGDMLNAAIQAYPFLFAEWSDDQTELKVSVT